MKRFALLAACLVAVLLAVGCATSLPKGGPIEGRWAPVGMDTGKAVPGTYIAFASDGTTEGFAGCNTFAGGYKTTDAGALSIGPLAMTKKACPTAAMVGEAAFVDVLSATRSFLVKDGVLTLYSETNEVLARLQPSKQAPLTGVIWVLRGYNNGKNAVVSTLTTSNITARFEDTGKVRGRSGCGKYEATYSTHGQEISIGAPKSAETTPCTSEQIAERDAYLAAIRTAATWQTGSSASAGGTFDSLELRTESGALAANYEAERASQ